LEEEKGGNDELQFKDDNIEVEFNECIPHKPKEDYASSPSSDITFEEILDYGDEDVHKVGMGEENSEISVDFSPDLEAITIEVEWVDLPIKKDSDYDRFNFDWDYLDLMRVMSLIIPRS